MTPQAGNKRAGEIADMPVASAITVALIPKVSEDLEQLQERTGLSRTDITNRAIMLYAFIDALLRTNSELLIRDKQTLEAQLIQIF